MPDDFSSNVSTRAQFEEVSNICWGEKMTKDESLGKRSWPLTLNSTLSHDDNPTPTKPHAMANSGWGTGSVPCPTFAGGREPTGECIFTEPAVQDAILSFFEEVAQDPENYRNPTFITSVYAPRPTVDAPFTLHASATIPEAADVQPAHPMLTPEQLELDEAQTKLADMRIALEACPEDIGVLAKGRGKLVDKIKNQEVLIKTLQVQALSSGSLGVSDSEDAREDWSPKVEGPQVPFAGTMVDSELLRAAGLGRTADEELEKLDDEEKAFL